MFTLHPEVTGGVFVLNIHRIPSKLHGCGTLYAPNRGKDVEGGVCCLCRTCAIHMPLIHSQSIGLAQRKGLQLLISFLYYFSLLHLDRPIVGAEVGRFERFLFLFLV